jgi:hypothetical protein
MSHRARFQERVTSCISCSAIRVISRICRSVPLMSPIQRDNIDPPWDCAFASGNELCRHHWRLALAQRSHHLLIQLEVRAHKFRRRQCHPLIEGDIGEVAAPE